MGVGVEGGSAGVELGCVAVMVCVFGDYIDTIQSRKVSGTPRTRNAPIDVPILYMRRSTM